MAQKFKAGDKVRLKTDTIDNVVMMVNGYRAREDAYTSRYAPEIWGKDALREVQCVWRDKTDTPHDKFYHEDTLILVEG